MRGFGSTRGALAALAFACAASVWLHLTGERAISGSSAVLGSPAYDMQSVVAPAASGPLLTALTYLLTATPLGPPIRRFLLNDNKVEILRELAAQSNNTPPLYYPMRRVDAAVYEAHAAAASSPDGSLSVALRDGFAPPSTAGDVAAAVPRPRQSSTAAASVYITSEDLHAATPNPDPSPNPNPNPNPNQDPNPNPNPNPSRHPDQDLHTGFRAGATTPSAVVERVLARVEASRAFSSVRPALAREAAAASTARRAEGP